MSGDLVVFAVLAKRDFLLPVDVSHLTLSPGVVKLSLEQGYRRPGAGGLYPGAVCGQRPTATHVARGAPLCQPGGVVYRDVNEAENRYFPRCRRGLAPNQ